MMSCQQIIYCSVALKEDNKLPGQPEARDLPVTLSPKEL